MSIASEIQRLQTAKEDIREALGGIGISIPSSAKIDKYAQYIKMHNTCLTFKIISAGTIYWRASTGSFTKTIQYKKNGGGWTSITSNTGDSAPSISVNAGDTIQFIGDNATYGIDNTVFTRFSGSTAKFEVEGNIMSLIDSTGFTTATTLASSYTFNRLFSNCNSLTSAENLVLPATTLTDYCYQYMFSNCTGLTTAPSILPATTLATNCYSRMFAGCTSLTQAPELPATTLTDYCYRAMFNNCTSLNYIKCLATDISATNCTTGWVNGVQTNSGTFVKNPNMSSWTTGSDGVPSNWTVQDAS